MQQSRTVSQKQNVQANISALNTKLSRLQMAQRKLTSELSMLRSTNTKVKNLKINDSRWKGKKRTLFDNHYSDYEQSVHQYVSRTEDSQEQLEEEIQRTQQSLDSYERTLSMLNSQISSLNYQIAQARRAQ